MSAGPMDRDDDTDRWLTSTEVARRLRVDRRTVTRWAVAGKLPSIRVGPHGYRRFRASAVDAVEDSSTLVSPRPRRNGTFVRPPALYLVTGTAGGVERDRAEEDFSVALGDRLRAARLERGWSLQDAATATGHGLEPMVIGSYERAERSMSMSHLVTLAAAYGLTPADLIPPPGTAKPEVVVRPITLAVDRLDQLPIQLAGPMSRYVAAVLEARGTPFALRVTIRSADLFVLAPALDSTPTGLIDQLDRWNVLVRS